MKAGWKTTEFWAMVVANLKPLLVTVGLIGTESADALGEAVVSGTEGIFAVIATAAYIISRAWVKARSTTPDGTGEVH